MFRIVYNRMRNIFIPRSINFLSPNSPGGLYISRAARSVTPMDENETADEWIDRMECYFNRPDIDGWELRYGLNEVAGNDMIPEPRLILAALCACRRVNDYACTTRTLEMVKQKTGNNDDIYMYLMQHIQPALKELGIDTPEKMGFSQPEFTMESFW